MISLEVIEREISDLEAMRDTSYRQCERLAWLYIVRDHLRGSSDDGTPELRGSEFLEAASGVSYPALMRVLDEHMETMKTLYPKSYQSLIDRIRGIR